MRVVLYQMADRRDVAENIKAACDVLNKIKADFVCFPEYFTIPADYKKRGKTVEDAWVEVTLPTVDALRKASEDFEGYIIGGTVVEKSDCYYNTCYVFKGGKIVAKYRKMCPIDEEVEMGIKPGNSAVSVETEFGRIGVLICADCLNSRVVDMVASKNDIVFLPISLTDPSHPRVEGHPVSERIAREYGVLVAKVSRVVGGVGVRSVVMSPEGIVAEAKSSEEEFVIAEI